MTRTGGAGRPPSPLLLDHWRRDGVREHMAWSGSLRFGLLHRHTWAPRLVVPVLCVGAFLAGWGAGVTMAGPALPAAADSASLPVVASGGDVADARASAVAADDARDEPTYVEMRNVLFHVHPQVALRIRSLHGTMRSLTSRPIFFDDPASFRIRIRDADVAISPEDLTALLNAHVFAYPGAPLRDLAVRFEGDQLVQTGKLRKGVSLPFEIRATVSLTPRGEIRIHATRTRVAGIGVTRLMRVLGLELDRVLNLRGAHGARVADNDIILDVERALPPPLIEGRLVAIAIRDGAMVQRFGPPAGAGAFPDLAIPDPDAPNYMFYRGGVLRFGKLVMLDADLQIVDLDPHDAFRFDLRRYLTQLVPGYSKTLPDGGLEVFMKDIDDAATARTGATGVRRPSAPAAAGGPSR